MHRALPTSDGVTEMLDVCVVGTGYVGLVTGTCLAEIGHAVTCVDSDAGKIGSMRAGRIPIYEPGLGELVGRNAARGRLRFTTDLASAVAGEALILIIAVGTPTGADGATAELGPLLSAVEAAARHRQRAAPGGFVVFTIKSTVPVGTCRAIEAAVARHLPAGAFAVVSNPEFLREGSAVVDFMEPDRIVVGSRSARGLSAMRALYAPLTDGGFTLFEASSIETSEMIKYASNIFLATKIGLINEFARLCERTGADVRDLATGIGLDRRIGPAGLRAGPGFGGSCFPKDLRALIGTAASLHSPMPIAEAVVRSNERQKRFAVDKIVEALDGDVRALRIAVLGVSFKAGTDDIREAPALSIIAELLDAGATVSAYDPAGGANARQELPLAEHATSALDAVAEADAVVIATEWPLFRELDWASVRDAMSRPLVLDLRNCLDGRKLADIGLDYVGLGRPRPEPSTLEGAPPPLSPAAEAVAGLGETAAAREFSAVPA